MPRNLFIITVFVTTGVLFVVTLSSIQAKERRTRSSPNFIRDCDVEDQDNHSTLYTLYHLPSDSQQKMIQIASELHKQNASRSWNAMSFSAARVLVTVDDIHWFNVLTLVMDFNDYISINQESRITHFSIIQVSDDIDETTLNPGLFVNSFIKQNNGPLALQSNEIRTNMDKKEDFAYVCNKMQPNENTMACVPSFVISTTKDESQEALQYEQAHEQVLWMVKKNESRVFSSVQQAIEFVNSRIDIEGHLLQPVMPNAFKVEEKSIRIQMPVLITSLDPMKAFYTPEIFSVFLLDTFENIPEAEIVSVRSDSLRFFQELEASELIKFQQYSIPKIVRGIIEYLNLDDTFQRDVDIPQTQEIFGTKSKSYELISCEIIVSNELEPFLVGCETNPISMHDLRLSEVLFDEVFYIILAEYVEQKNYISNLRYWRSL